MTFFDDFIAHNSILFSLFRSTFLRLSKTQWRITVYYYGKLIVIHINNNREKKKQTILNHFRFFFPFILALISIQSLDSIPFQLLKFFLIVLITIGWNETSCIVNSLFIWTVIMISFFYLFSSAATKNQKRSLKKRKTNHKWTNEFWSVSLKTRHKKSYFLWNFQSVKLFHSPRLMEFDGILYDQVEWRKCRAVYVKWTNQFNWN